MSNSDSSPCFAHKLALGSQGYETVDRQTEIDIAHWRRGERQRLIAARLAISAADRAKIAASVLVALDAIIDPATHPAISIYWPFRGELDLREWMNSMAKRGARMALPVVIAKGQPLIFRAWRPGCRMQRGIWNIPVPAEDERIVPDVVISPVIGADRKCYRLGYGGGFYDRTLAALANNPLVIGVGHPTAEIETIYPLPHDIPMDRIILGEAGWERPR